MAPLHHSIEMHSCTRAHGGRGPKRCAGPSAPPPPPATAPAQRCTWLAGPDCEIIDGRAAGAATYKPGRPRSRRRGASGPSASCGPHLEEGRDRADAARARSRCGSDLPRRGRLRARRRRLAGPARGLDHGRAAGPLRGQLRCRARSRTARATDGCLLAVHAAARRRRRRRRRVMHPLAGAGRASRLRRDADAARAAPGAGPRGVAREVRGTFSFRAVTRSRKMTLNLTSTPMPRRSTPSTWPRRRICASHERP